MREKANASLGAQQRSLRCAAAFPSVRSSVPFGALALGVQKNSSECDGVPPNRSLSVSVLALHISNGRN